MINWYFKFGKVVVKLIFFPLVNYFLIHSLDDFLKVFILLSCDFIWKESFFFCFFLTLGIIVKYITSSIFIDFLQGIYRFSWMFPLSFYQYSILKWFRLCVVLACSLYLEPSSYFFYGFVVGKASVFRFSLSLFFKLLF